MTFGRPELWLAAILLFAAAAIAETAAVAQGASPQAFLEQIYKSYRGKNGKGIDTSKPDNVRRYFAPSLAKAMLKDMADARRKDDVPLLGGDPFVDAQDWEIAELQIETRPGDTRRSATGIVTFTNAAQPRTVTLDLVKTGDGWRIAEIKAPSGSLKELYKIK